MIWGLISVPETAKTPFSSSILYIFGPYIIAILPWEYIQGFQRMLNLFMMVLDHTNSIWHDLRPDFGARKACPLPPTVVNMGPLRNLRKCNFLARFSVSVVQVQHLCYPESLCRGFKGCWILLWWSQFIWNLIWHDLKPDYVKEVENVIF